MCELAKEDHTYHLTPEELQKIPRAMVSHFEQVRHKWAYETSTDFRAAVSTNIVYTASQANKLKSLFLQNNTGDGIPLQAHRGETSLNGIGVSSFFFLMRILFVTVGFVYSRWRSTVADGSV